MAERPKINVPGNQPEPKQYFNLRSQLYFHLREVIENSEMLIADERFRGLIEQELRAIKKMVTAGESKLRVIPKEQIKQAIGRSPDFADVISMRCVFDLMPVINAPKRTVKSF